MTKTQTLSNQVGFVWHERYMWHMTGIAGGSMPAGGYVEPDLLHLESAPAKRRIRNLIEVTGLIDALTPLRPRTATEAEVRRIHDPAYLDRLRVMSEAGYGEAGEIAPVGRDSYPIALLSAGGGLAAADAIIAGTVARAYALVRPAGHHAERDRGRGFCLLANGSIVAAHLQAVHGLRRVAIVDWDVHHGNGAQSIFYDDPSVLTLSIHEEANYPFDSGGVEEAGSGAGLGSNINVPLPSGSGRGAYLSAFDRIVGPALRRFRPEMILVASGFDSCMYDPLGRQLNTAETFREMTKLIMELADELCGSRLLLIHEGGYSTFYAPWCGLAVMEQLTGVRTDAIDPYAFANDHPGQVLKPHQEAVINRVTSSVALIPEPS